MASFPEPIQDFQKEVICPICLNFFVNPVSIDCGHSFCHSCLLRNWQDDSTLFSCPICGSVSQQREHKANVRLGKLTDIARKLITHGLPYPEGHGNCEIHQKVKKLFCGDDLSPICVSCSQSQEHETHRICCIDEAVENFRKKFQETVTGLQRKTGVVVQQIKKEKMKYVFLEKEIEIQKKNILSEFHKMIQFLHKEKDAHLSYLKAQGKTSTERLSRRIRELFLQNQELQNRIRELEEECNKTDLDVLHDVKGVLRKNESVLHKDRETVYMDLFIPPIPGLMEQIFNFKVDITLDCSTADLGLIISEDLKTVRYGGVQEEASTNTVQVLGTQSFISGRYYWEVEVPNNTAWYVGIKSKEFQDFFVLRNRLVNNSYYLYAMAQHKHYSHTQYRHINIDNLKVGIFLDYENGEISFYHVKNKYLIYAFPKTPFSGLLVPFFCLSKRNDCCLTICP